MKNNQKTILERFITGLKVGWNAPTLPDKLNKFNFHPFVWIFRVIGDLSIVTVVSQKHLLFFHPIQYIVLFIAIIVLIYFVMLSLMKLFYGIYIIRRGDLNVKNSPIENFATITAKLLHCWKFGCELGGAGFGLATTSVVADSILEAGGQEKRFTSLIGNGVKLFIGGKPADSIVIERNKNINKMESSNNAHK